MLGKRQRRRLRKMLTGPICICGLLFVPWAFVNGAEKVSLSQAEKETKASKDKEQFASMLSDDIETHADDVTMISGNVVARGNVRILYGDFMITCDSALITVASKDIEAIGNVRFSSREVREENLDLWQFEDLQRNVDVLAEHIGSTALPNGGRKMRVRVTRMRYAWEADHVIGNLQTGAMNAKNFYSQADNVYFVRGQYAERSPGGKVTVKGVDLSTCPHFADHEEHFSLSAGEATLTPNRKDFQYGPLNKEGRQEMANYEKYWVTLSDNIFLNVWKTPIFWFPALALPPAEELPRYLRIAGGYNSDMGMQFLISKRFMLSNDPYFYTQPTFAYYSKRGFGIGDETALKTENSWTQLSVFGILDKNPNGVRGWQKDFHESYQRFDIPRDRYELRLEHVHHITPRLDIRGRVDALSDINFLQDYYDERNNSDNIATFFSSDYQLERFIPSIYVRPKINKFTAETESLPEIRLDIPRQHIVAGLYYQGQNSIDWLTMKWRDFSYPAGGTYPNTELQNPSEYKSFRWDTLQMFNYPLRFDWLNFIPRAGVRLTYYENTSKTKVSMHDLQYYKWSQMPDYSGTLLNDLFGRDVIPAYANLYDNQGGGKLRVLGELGFEANTKVSRSWDSVKNAFWELDGIRHVFVPYVNYNYNPPTNLRPENIYFFDELDRYDAQNFVRLGARNTLQTRRGPYYREEIHDWLSMENYFDIHIQDPQGFGKMGDIGTMLKFNPFPELQFTSDLLLNPSCGDNSYYSTMREGKLVPEPGIAANFISAWNNKLSYEFMEDYRIFGAFDFQNNYYQRTMYSMGSALSQVVSGMEFPNQYLRYQQVKAGLEFPIPFDERMVGAVEVAYDLEAALLRDARFRLTRNFHCWDVTLEAGSRNRRNYYGKTYSSNDVTLSIGLTALPSAKFRLKAL